MLNNDQFKHYLKNAGREITFMLYNYNNIKSLIADRKNDLIDTLNLSTNSWLKSRKSNGNSFEDILIIFEEDKHINRLLKWENLINSFLNKLYDYEDKTLYYLIKMKYLDKYDEEIILETFNFTKKELNYNVYKIIELLYEKALEEKLYMEEAKKECKINIELLQLLTKKVALEKQQPV